MEIEFDPAKDAANIAKHGVSLALAVEMDFDTAVVVADDRKNYGEDRFRAFGIIGGRAYTFCLVFTLRGEVVRVISLRRANRREIALYAPS